MVGWILSLAAVSFVISLVMTWIVKRIAPGLGFVDKPGQRKIHQTPKPLGGGIAIFWAIVLPMALVLGIVHLWNPARLLPSNAVAQKGGYLLLHEEGHRLNTALETFDLHGEHWPGVRQQTPLAIGVISAAFVLHLLGLIDDKRALGPYVKLLVQLVVSTALVVKFDLRALTNLPYVASTVLTILWIVGVTNAFNFLDNMDGLSAGVAAVCTTAFLITALSIQQWFVAATLALLLGALLGFLMFNFPPASIFMGDSGSLVIGFVLGVLTVRTTYLRPEQQANFAGGWYAVFAPLIVLAVPLYDMIVVSLIRIRNGKSPFVGDTNHFSHRLVRRGMSRRTAVLCIYLVTAATSIAAILLTYVQSPAGAVLIFLQTLLILGVVALLEQHPLPPAQSETPDPLPVFRERDG